MPKGLIIKKGFEGPDGKLVYDKSYIGEDAWIDERNDQLESSSEIAGWPFIFNCKCVTP